MNASCPPSFLPEPVRLKPGPAALTCPPSCPSPVSSQPPPFQDIRTGSPKKKGGGEGVGVLGRSAGDGGMADRRTMQTVMMPTPLAPPSPAISQRLTQPTAHRRHRTHDHLRPALIQVAQSEVQQPCQRLRVTPRPPAKQNLRRALSNRRAASHQPPPRDALQSLPASPAGSPPAPAAPAEHSAASPSPAKAALRSRVCRRLRSGHHPHLIANYPRKSSPPIPRPADRSPARQVQHRRLDSNAGRTAIQHRVDPSRQIGPARAPQSSAGRAKRWRSAPPAECPPSGSVPAPPDATACHSHQPPPRRHRVGHLRRARSSSVSGPGQNASISACARSRSSAGTPLRAPASQRLPHAQSPGPTRAAASPQKSSRRPRDRAHSPPARTPSP